MEIPAAAAGTLAALEAAGYESRVVGGCVRDALLGREPHDWDICTAAPPEAVERCFAGHRVLETGLRHGTVTLLTEAGPLEITTFRRDGDYSDRRRPDSVAFVSDLREDLARRDFTINAMAYSPLRGLCDPFGGREDLRRGLIRCVGDPARRFEEDALRILRALRFAARYGFSIEEETAAALREKRALLDWVAPERIFSELKGFLCAPGAGALLLAYPELFFQFLPELRPLLGCEQHRPRAHLWDVWGHTARVVDAAPANDILRLAALFHDSGKPRCFVMGEDGLGHFYGHPAAGARVADEALRRLHCDNAAREAVVLLVERHEMKTNGSPRAVRRLLSAVGEENFRRLLALRRADAAGHAPEARVDMLAQTAADQAAAEAILAAGACLTLKDLAVTGDDLLSLGFAPGPPVGQALRSLLGRVLDGDLPNERKTLLSALQESADP